MFTSLAIGVTLIAAMFLWLTGCCLISMLSTKRRPAGFSLNEIVGYLLLMRVVTSPVCGGAVWLWERALA